MCRQAIAGATHEIAKMHRYKHRRAATESCGPLGAAVYRTIVRSSNMHVCVCVCICVADNALMRMC